MADTLLRTLGAARTAPRTPVDAAAELRVLATSREPLGVAGEVRWSVPPLSLPAVGEAATVPAVAGSAAGELFVQRARALVPDFRLTDGNVAAVARLCRRLDGLPLAIELAAARMRVLSVQQIAAGLDDAFRLLVGGVRTGPARHQTLRAALDWSHDLLTEPERAVFRRLAVFPGSFDLAAAEQVAAVGGIASDDVLDLLTRLVDRSLVTVQRLTDSTRYRLLATVRDYGRERLAAADERTTAGRAHLAHYCELAERIEPLLTGSEQALGLDRLETEGNNLRIALAFARETGEVATGTRLAAALWPLCCLRGHYSEGREWLDWAATADPDGSPRLRAKALRGWGGLAFLQCDYGAAVRRLEASLQICRELEDPAGAASVLHMLGSVAREQGRYSRAESLHRESLEIFAAGGDRLGVAQAHGYPGFAAWLQCHWQAAIAHCEQALSDFRSLGDAEGTAWAMISLGTVAAYQGDHDRSAALLGEAYALAQRVNYPEGVAWSLHERGLLALRLDQGDAEILLTDSLARHRALGDRWRTASVLSDLAAAALALGGARRAAGLLGAAAGIRAEIGSVVAPCERPDHDRVEDGARGALGSDAFATAWARGRDGPLEELLTVDEPVEPAEPATTRRPVTPLLRSSASSPTSVTPTPRLRIRMLGAATVQRADRLLTPADWGYGKPRELMFLLASTQGQTKDQIGVARWPELVGPQLRNAFHIALRDMRRALGDTSRVGYADGRYALYRSGEFWCDLHVFEGPLAEARRAKSPADVLRTCNGPSWPTAETSSRGSPTRTGRSGGASSCAAHSERPCPRRDACWLAPAGMPTRRRCTAEPWTTTRWRRPCTVT